MYIQMRVAPIIVFVLTLATIRMAFGADVLARKAKTPRETYPNVDVIYDSVTTPHGERLRTIITKPHDARGKLPVIFVAGWLSCDTVEAPPNKDPGPDNVRHDATGLAFREIAQLPGFSFFRVDKQGVGDSEGNCAENDFESELAGLSRRVSRVEELRLYRHEPSLHPWNQQRRRIRAFGSRNGCRKRSGARLHCRRRLGEDVVRAHARNRAAPLCLNGQVARRSKRADESARLPFITTG